MPRAIVVVTALIVGRPTCPPCLAQRSGLTIAGAKRTVAGIGESVAVRRIAKAICRSCGDNVATVSIEPSS